MLEIALCSLLLTFILANVLRLYPTSLDWKVAKLLNGSARSRPIACKLAFAAVYPTLEGLILVSLGWSCWFGDTRLEARAALIVGASAAVVAGLIAHLLRYTVPARARPIFDQVLQLHTPEVFGDIVLLRARSFSDSPGFPSQRTAMFAGLSTGILQVHVELGLLALACTIAIEFCRVYLGLHYLTDSLGSFALGSGLVLLGQGQWNVDFGLWLITWEWASASTFYMCAFLASYLMVTTFHDVRELLRSFSP